MINSLSSLATREMSRSTINTLQSRLVDATKEASTGRHADVGVHLGSETARALDLRLVADDLETFAKTNALLAVRLETTGQALDALAVLAHDFAGQALAQMGDSADRGIFVAQARDGLARVAELLAATSDGAFVFAGDNVAQRPFDDYLAVPPGPARLAVQAAFTTEFGFPPDDPAVATIPKAAYDTYMDGPFSALFQDPSWQASFSSASDDPVRARISQSATMEAGVGANHEGIRRLVAALVMVVDGGAELAGAEPFQRLAERVHGLAAGAVADLTGASASVGIDLARLDATSERLDLERSLVDRGIASLEEVDVVAAITRMNQLYANLEASYAATVRLQRLSILDYL